MRTLLSNPGGESGELGVRGTPSGAGTTASAPQNNLSPEAQAILIEAQRPQTSSGGFDPLPKTGITPRESNRNQPIQQ